MAARMIRIYWPDNGKPEVPAAADVHALDLRLGAVRAAMDAHGFERLVIYGDREHGANIQWVSGFDPRFEEALMIVGPGEALLLVGNECLDYASLSPLVQSGALTLGHCAAFSLMNQPRGGKALADWLDGVIPAGARVGAVGWKWFGTDEAAMPESALDLPAFIADPLRARAGSVVNATDVFQDPARGLRVQADSDEIARLEFANHMAGAAMRRMIHALRNGISDFEAIEAAKVGGLPLSCHLTFATGARARNGLSSPTGQKLAVGTPASFNIAHQGANICRSGWLARGELDLPEGARDYLSTFAIPYMRAMASWCAMMEPGVRGGAIWSAIQEALPREVFNVTLNPGHLIGSEEWMSSPIYEGSDVALKSGMALQSDVIPAHPVYGSCRMEDGYVIADEALRADLDARHPEVAARCRKRQNFMRDVIGIEVPDSLLPLSDSGGIITPYFLDPAQVIAL